MSGSRPMATNMDQNGAAASRIPLTAKKRRCPRSCSIKKVYNPAGMKCCGTHIKAVMLEEYCVATSQSPAHSMCPHPMLTLGNPSHSMRGPIDTHSPVSIIRKMSMPPKKMMTAAASTMLQPRRSRVNMSRTSPTPSHVQMGTAQFSAAIPSQRPTNPGVM